MKMYQYHEISNMFPMMQPDKLTELADDIKENGLHEPIVIYEGKILDGRNRYQACQIVGIDPKTETYSGDSPASYVVSLNLKRRQLTASQAAAVAVEYEPYFAKEAKQRQIRKPANSVGNNLLPTKSKRDDNKRASRQAAKSVGAGVIYTSKAKSIKQKSPDVFEQLKSGKIDIKKAENILYKQSEATKKDTSHVIITSEQVQLYNCDILDAPIADNSISAIITDPPYPREFLDCWSKLAEFAVRKLKDGGVLLAVSGQSYLPEVYERMNIDGLSYYWTNCIRLTVSADLKTKRTKTQWKPILWYVKGNYSGTYQNTDVYSPNYSETVEGQEYHKWGQSLPLFEELVDRFSYAEDIVCDPFLGGGTTAIACINKKRKFVGVELDKDTFSLASQRISEILK